MFGNKHEKGPDLGKVEQALSQAGSSGVRNLTARQNGSTIEIHGTADNLAAKQAAFALLDALRIIDISNNLGDAKTLITHPATTTHRAMGPEGRAAIGLSDGVVRLSVGLEDVEDLIRDLGQALKQV